MSEYQKEKRVQVVFKLMDFMERALDMHIKSMGPLRIECEDYVHRTGIMETKYVDQ